MSESNLKAELASAATRCEGLEHALSTATTERAELAQRLESAGHDLTIAKKESAASKLIEAEEVSQGLC